MQERNLEGITALVTGGAKRIGRAIALKLADHGANVIVHYNVSEQEAGHTCQEILRRGSQAWPLQADLSQPDVCRDLATRAAGIAQPVQILVNNASVFTPGRLADLSPEEFDRNMHVHALAPLVLTRWLAENLPDDAEGRVVNLLDAYIGTYQFQHAAYNLSKRVLLDLTRMMAVEFAPRLTVNAVAPGVTLPGQDGTGTGERALVEGSPLRAGAKPGDISDAVLYLINARLVTGQVLYVDGGGHLVGGTWADQA
ncbi:MAG: SDR family oxidoreductase [Armatimonadetes bacterium]|nr:SDR family oxidoreductase [Armatimonadota bacterium]